MWRVLQRISVKGWESPRYGAKRITFWPVDCKGKSMLIVTGSWTLMQTSMPRYDEPMKHNLQLTCNFSRVNSEIDRELLGGGTIWEAERTQRIVCLNTKFSCLFFSKIRSHHISECCILIETVEMIHVDEDYLNIRSVLSFISFFHLLTSPGCFSRNSRTLPMISSRGAP